MTAYFDSKSDDLYQATLAWQKPVLDSTLPFWLKFKMINGASPMFANTILTKDGRFAVLESPHDMSGALGTMDQRIAAHAFYTAFFPDLDQAELELFAHCQSAAGEIPHFDGNIHFIIGDPNVDYGITGWPDLTTGWVAQIAKFYRLTGNQAFLDRMLPHVNSAMDWLQDSGQKNNGIPKGGSSFDYGQKSEGEFIYTASLYLASLRAAAAISLPADVEKYNQRFNQIQKTVMTDLWNGSFFRTFRTTAGVADENSFVNALAGDWLTRVSGLPHTLAPDVTHEAIAQIIDRHQTPFGPVAPSEVTPAGKIIEDTSYVLQLEPFVGCEAIYENYVDAGLETIHRNDVLAWETKFHPGWGMGLSFNYSAHGRPLSLRYYVTNPTTWFVLNALTGTSLDVPNNILYLSPRLATTETEAHLPVYFPRFWGWVDYVPAKHLLSLRIDKTFPSNEADQKPFYQLTGQPANVEPEKLVVKSVAADGNAPLIALPEPFVVQEGAVLNLSAYIDKLAPNPKSERVPPLQK
jgi:non-lysosomal glucosylceramidase